MIAPSSTPIQQTRVDPEVLREVLAANRPKLFAIAAQVQQAVARSEK